MRALAVVFAVILSCSAATAQTLLSHEGGDAAPALSSSRACDGVCSKDILAIGGPDWFGYMYADSRGVGGPTFDWVELRDEKRATKIAWDKQGKWGGVEWSMPFEFYGNTTQRGHIDQIGTLTMDWLNATIEPLSCPPDYDGTSVKGGVIGVRWAWLSSCEWGSGVGYVAEYGAGECPWNGYSGRCVVAEWTGLCFDPYPLGTHNPAGTFEVILLEDDSFVMQYLDVGDFPAQAHPVSISLEEPLGAPSLVYSCGWDDDPASPGLAIRFWVPPVVVGAEDDRQSGCPDTGRIFLLSAKNSTGRQTTLGVRQTEGTYAVEIPAQLEDVPDGEWRDFQAIVHVPPNASPGSSDVERVEVYDVANPSTSWSIDLVTAVEELGTLSGRDMSEAAVFGQMDNAVTYYDGRIYSMGRKITPDGGPAILDVASGTWRRGATAPWDVAEVVDAAVGRDETGDRVMVMFDSITAFDPHCAVYDIDLDQWRRRPLPEGYPAHTLWAPDIACDDDQNVCYVTGGSAINGGGTETTTFRYDVSTHTMTPLADFTTGRNFHSSFLWNGMLCIAGGFCAWSDNFGYLSSTQCMDLATGAWHPENADMGPLPFGKFGAADGMIWSGGAEHPIMAGGSDENVGSSTSVFYFDGSGWVLGPALDHQVYRLEGTGVGDVFYALGGARYDTFVTRWNQQIEACSSGTTDLSIEKTLADQQGQGIGTELTWRIEARNNGPERAHQAVVTDPLPASLDYVSDSCGGSWDGSSRTWSWELGDLPAGGRLACELVTSVIALDRGTITNHVLIASNGDDPNPGNEDAEATAQVKQPGIPATTPVGIGLLAVLFALVGVLVLRRLGD